MRQWDAGGDMWAVLGIAPTSDPIAIRRAYARQLKTSDVGDNAEAFARLRAARERALAAAADEASIRDNVESSPDLRTPASSAPGSVVAGDPMAEPSEQLSLATPVIEADADIDGRITIAMPLATEPGVAATPSSAGPAEGPGHGASIDTDIWHATTIDIDAQVDDVSARTSSSRDASGATDDDFRTMATLLFPDEDVPAPLAEAEVTRWMKHFRCVVADPRMDQLGYYDDVQRWTSELLAGSVPRSDPVLLPVAEYFRWTANVDEVGESPAVAHITARIEMLAFVDAVCVPGHRLHKAWRELTTPANEGSRRGWVSRKRVAELLQTVRQDHPQLENAFDWYRVTLWESHDIGGRPRGLSGGAVLAIIILGANLLRIFAAGETPDPRPVPPPISVPSYAVSPGVDLTTPEADIPDAIAWLSEGKADGTGLADRNPEFYAMLSDAWSQDRMAGLNRPAFNDHVRRLFDERHLRIASRATFANLSELTLARLDGARYLRTSASACISYMRGQGSVLPPDIVQRQHAARYRIILETRGAMAPRETGSTFMIEGLIMKRIAKRAGLSLDRLRDALNDKGEDGAICNARIALMEVALELPRKQAMTILPYL